jgi:hypothetical protein
MVSTRSVRVQPPSEGGPVGADDPSVGDPPPSDDDGEDDDDAGTEPSNGSSLPAQVVRVHQTPRFSISPSLSQGRRAILDYSIPKIAKLYVSATKPLSKTEFDIKAGALTPLLSSLALRAREHGWHGHGSNGILKIPNNITIPNGASKSLIKEYGQISLPHIRNYVGTFANTETREVQDDEALYQCLKVSLTHEAMAKIDLYETEWTVAGEPSGVAMLKVIIRQAYVDTNATTMHVRTKLSKLDSYMESLAEHNVTLFNEYVYEQLHALTARGEQTLDLLPNLFKGYEAAKDTQFLEYIRKKKAEFEEGTVFLEPEILMSQASIKYRTLVEKGEWDAPSESEAKILALTTQVKELQAKKSEKPKSKAKGDSKGKKKKGKKSDKPKTDKYASLKKPSASEPHTKTFDGDKTKFCTNHQAWGTHLASECKGYGLEKDSNGKPIPKGFEPNATDKKGPPSKSHATIMRMSKALTTEIEKAETEE